MRTRIEGLSYLYSDRVDSSVSYGVSSACDISLPNNDVHRGCRTGFVDTDLLVPSSQLTTFYSGRGEEKVRRSILDISTFDVSDL